MSRARRVAARRALEPALSLSAATNDEIAKQKLRTAWTATKRFTDCLRSVGSKSDSTSMVCDRVLVSIVY